MNIRFFKGVLRTEGTQDIKIYWAETPFGVKAVSAETGERVGSLDAQCVTGYELITEMNVPGLDKAGTEVIVHNILGGEFLARWKPGEVGEALLFTLVNEAIQVLEKTASDFLLTDK